MKIIKGLFVFILLSIAFISIISAPGCANIIPPSGGPKDTLPPVLVNVTPRDSTLRFNGKTIIFTFDEYVEIKEKEKYIIINPTPKSVPTIDYKLRVVTVKLRDTLQPNTTYSINFGKAIRDVNEGNALKDFTYVYSTGSYLDSLEFSGRVVVAVTGKADSTLIVMLHRNLTDSAVINERPRYVTTVDTTGRFTFHNLAPGTYAVYALKDEGGARRYSSKSQLFAFADSPVVVRRQTPPVLMYAYAEEVEKLPSQKSKTSTTNTPPPPKKKLEKGKIERLQLQINTAGGEFDILDTLQIQFPVPLKAFDSTKFRFTDEQYKDIPRAQYRFIKDSALTRFTILYVWKPDTKYHILADKEFAEDTLGRKLLKNDTISFHTKRESEYGEVRLRFKNLDLSKHPVLQFVESDVVKYTYVFGNTREFKVKLFRPAEYDLRILYDDNQNGRWDPGDFFDKHRQPEKVFSIRINNSRHKLNVKANWDNDVDFTL